MKTKKKKDILFSKLEKFKNEHEYRLVFIIKDSEKDEYNFKIGKPATFSTDIII